ncbi:hypothetical protein RRG08_037426 [Elysia crispata]|uniref:Uncharacterized protein n=1 Tax=Elysia crispata TaxID=231223 RepID=A0AAE1DXR7_9GAST|nr:hypothetical protein RRG08_037426 [Elysia crispata]
MSGAHYIVGHNRSRSPSPVSMRNRSSQRGSFMSETEDPEAGPAFRVFGSDGRPRRGSSRRSIELEPSRETSDPGKHVPSGESLISAVSKIAKPDLLQVESGLQPVSPSGSVDYSREVSMPVPSRPDQQSQQITEEANSGKPTSSDEVFSTASNQNNKKFAREGSVGFLVSRDTVSPQLPDVSMDIIVATKSRPSTSNSNAPGVKEMISPSEFQKTSNGEMKQLSPNSQRGYGSFSVGSMNGGGRGLLESPVSPVSPSSESSTSQQEQIRRSSTSSNLSRPSYYTPSMVDELRKRNRLYFLDPITKLMYFHGFPWKLTLQIAKVVIITVQIIIFGSQRQSIVEFFEKSNLAFKHLLLKDWDPAYETMPYPPATGKYAIYNLGYLYQHMNFAMEHYHKLPQESLAAMELNRNSSGMPYPIELCFTANDVIIFPNHTYIVRSGVIHNCTDVYPENGTIGNFTYDIEKFINDTSLPIVFNRTLEIVLKMYVKTFHLNLLETRYGPTCYNDTVKIIYENEQRSGQILVDLTSLPSEVPCEAQTLSDAALDETKEVRVRFISLDAVVMVICCLSTILCARSLKRSNNLRQDTARFFKMQRNKPLKFSDHLEYINMWYVIIICNDALTIVGSAFKIQLESRVFTISTANYELCSMLLGIGVLLTYIGILRYLGFFKSYNVLILTVKTSFPHVLRFLVCAICLYTGFLFCGWTIFSPYNLKFRSLSSASECLFSLVNGDDMFVSFSALTNSSDAIWYMNRAYLYIFISLFIYVVISVFIAVIMDNYENLKNYYEGNRPDTVIGAFMKEDGEMPLNEVFSHVRRSSRTCQSWFFCIFPCLSCFSRKLKFEGMGDRQDLTVTI